MEAQQLPAQRNFNELLTKISSSMNDAIKQSVNTFLIVIFTQFCQIEVVKRLICDKNSLKIG